MLTRRDWLKGTIAGIGSSLLSGSFTSVYPYVQNLTGNSVTILWQALRLGSGIVRWWETGGVVEEATARVRTLPAEETGLYSPLHLYRADLTGLLPGTRYAYRVFLDGQNLSLEEGFRFRTEGTGTFEFLVFGDSGAATREQYEIAQRMSAENPALVLLTGDLVYMSGSHPEFHQRYLPYYCSLMRRVPFFPTPGNHDYETAKAEPYLSFHVLPTAGVPVEDRGRYYSFDWSNVHFVSIDTNDPLRDAISGRGRMLEWLEADLKGSDRSWKIAYFHHPPYATGPNENESTVSLVREHLLPVLERHGVRLVFSGHEHSYQRSLPIYEGAVASEDRGIVFVTTGGGGAFLYPVHPSPRLAIGESVHHYVRARVEEERLSISAVRRDGEIIDRFTLGPIVQTAAVSAATEVR